MLNNAEPPTIERLSTGERVAKYISGQIFDGTLAPGTRVPQDEIAQRLGVSRIPVREALIALEREGWVRNELHRGAFISQLDRNAVQDHYDVFGLLYGFAATLTIERGDFTSAGRTLTEICAQFGATNAADFGRLVVAFHRTVIEASGSSRLVTVLRSLSGLIPGEFFEVVPAARRIEQSAMQTIAAAISHGRASEARETYAAMMHEVGEQVVTVFADRGLFDSTPNEE